MDKNKNAKKETKTDAKKEYKTDYARTFDANLPVENEYQIKPIYYFCAVFAIVAAFALFVGTLFVLGGLFQIGSAYSNSKGALILGLSLIGVSLGLYYYYIIHKAIVYIITLNNATYNKQLDIRLELSALRKENAEIKKILQDLSTQSKTAEPSESAEPTATEKAE